MNDYTTAISLVSLQSVERLNAVIDASPHQLHFELSYEMTPALVGQMRPMLEGSVVSVHAACPNVEFFPNLASNDTRVVGQSFKDLEMSLDTACSFGADILVLHPGYGTNRAIPSHNGKRQVLLTSDEFKPFIWREKGSICSPDYLESEPYLTYCGQARENLARFSETCGRRGVHLAVENLNPRVGYLFQTPDEMVSLVKTIPGCSICLDVGHLWVSSCLYGFDYLEGIRKILATGKVVTTHLHANSSLRGEDGTPLRLEDDHASLDKYGFPYREVIAEIARSGANMVLEVKEEPLENYRLLHSVLESVGRPDRWP